MTTAIRTLLTRTLWACALLVVTGSAGATGLPTVATYLVAAYAPSISAKAEKSTKKPKKNSAAKRSKGGGVSFHDGSAESRSERDRRLTRECRGRSNSGLCEGYTY